MRGRPVAPAPKHTRARSGESLLAGIDGRHKPIPATFPSYCTSHAFMALPRPHCSRPYGPCRETAAGRAGHRSAAGPCNACNNAASQQIKGRARIGGTPRTQEGRRNIAILRPAAVQRSERASDSPATASYGASWRPRGGPLPARPCVRVAGARTAVRGVRRRTGAFKRIWVGQDDGRARATGCSARGAVGWCGRWPCWSIDLIRRTKPPCISPCVRALFRALRGTAEGICCRVMTRIGCVR